MGSGNSTLQKIRPRLKSKSSSKFSSANSNSSSSLKGSAKLAPSSPEIPVSGSSSPRHLPYTDDSFEKEENVMGDALDYILRRPVISPVTVAPRNVLLITGHGPNTVPYLTRLYPEAHIHVHDIFRPASSLRLPPRCTGVDLNITEGALPFPSEAFDLVIFRAVNRATSIERWNDLIPEAHRILRPNGWFEIIGYSQLNAKTGPWGRDFFRLYTILSERDHAALHAIDGLDPTIISTGFENLHHQRYECPIGPYGGPTGDVMLRMVEQWCELVVQHTRSTGEDEVADDLQYKADGWLQEVHEVDSHVFVHAITSQKP
ncbi:MAG: hypothetical protein DHS80DRAFT_31061 [Piptocephalis tieghemiana]|nr:MAG: hypothetical protein DHS80DRAFT_31061 [Piptocephalis tieghemiana]